MSKIRMLIADDHQIIIDGIKSLLKESDTYEIVAEAANGKEAIDLVKTSDIDILLLDINMPVMNGLEVATEVLREYPYVKIVCLSMVDDPTLIGQMIKMGINGYILKNTGRKELIQVLDKVINGDVYYPVLEKQPQYSDTTIRQLYQERKAASPILSEMEAKALINKIKSYSTEEKPFLKKDISLSKLAALVEVPPHVLSYAINKSEGKNFFEFINTYRIEEAKKMLGNAAYSNLTIEGIGYEVGFRNKSTFYMAFKKLTGTTPSQYLKNIA